MPVRSKLPPKHVSKGLSTRSTERQTKKSPQKAKPKSSQRPLSAESKKASIDRVPTPLAERKNEEEHRQSERKLALRSKIHTEISRNREYSHPWIHDMPRKTNKGRIEKTIVKRRHYWSRLGRDKGEPPLKERTLGDEVPTIIECWQ